MGRRRREVELPEGVSLQTVRGVLKRFIVREEWVRAREGGRRRRIWPATRATWL